MKPYKTHLLERLQTTEDRVGYLRAALEEDEATFERAVQDVCDSISFADVPPSTQSTARKVAELRDEDQRAYNAEEIAAIHRELIGTVEYERLGKTPWARSVVYSLVQRIANLRHNVKVLSASAELATTPVETGRDYQRRLYDECLTAGWDSAQQNTFAEEIAHLHEELSEAFRAFRLHKDFAIRQGENGKPEGVPIEFADVIIGLFYNAELHGCDLFAAIEEKHQFNLTRNYNAEGRQLHPLPAPRQPEEENSGSKPAGE